MSLVRLSSINGPAKNFLKASLITLENTKGKIQEMYSTAKHLAQVYLKEKTKE